MPVVLDPFCGTGGRLLERVSMIDIVDPLAQATGQIARTVLACAGVALVTRIGLILTAWYATWKKRPFRAQVGRFVVDTNPTINNPTNESCKGHRSSRSLRSKEGSTDMITSLVDNYVADSGPKTG
jgi:hypothetical protein